MRRIRVTFRREDGNDAPIPSVLLLKDCDRVSDIIESIRARFPIELASSSLFIHLGAFRVPLDEDADVIRDDDHVDVVIGAAHKDPTREKRKAPIFKLLAKEPKKVKATIAKAIQPTIAKKIKPTIAKTIQPTIAKKIKPTITKVKKGVAAQKKVAVAVIESEHKVDLVMMVDDDIDVDQEKIDKHKRRRQAQRIKRKLPKNAPTPDQEPIVEQRTSTEPSPTDARRPDKSFSRVSAAIAAKALPKGHVRFDGDDDKPVVVAIGETEFDLPGGMNVDRAKRLSNFSFHMKGPVTMEVEEVGELVDNEQQALLKTTMAVRGNSFFAPRTLSYFGVSNAIESSHVDDALQDKRCGALEAVAASALTAGCSIAFKELEIVNWSPQLSPFRIAEVICVDNTTRCITIQRDDDHRDLPFNDLHDVRLVSAPIPSTIDNGIGLHDVRLVSAPIPSTIDNDIADALEFRRQSLLAELTPPEA